MLDTLKLAQSLERGGFSKEMAEATAASFNSFMLNRDTLKFARSLEKGGFDRKLAEATVMAIAEALA